MCCGASMMPAAPVGLLLVVDTSGRSRNGQYTATTIHERGTSRRRSSVMEIPRENLGGEITLAVSRPPSAADTDPNRLVDSAFRTLVRSTTSTGRGVVADALRAVDPVGTRDPSSTRQPGAAAICRPMSLPFPTFVRVFSAASSFAEAPAARATGRNRSQRVSSWSTSRSPSHISYCRGVHPRSATSVR